MDELRPILESKSMRAIFQEKGKGKKVFKRAKYLKT